MGGACLNGLRAVEAVVARYVGIRLIMGRLMRWVVRWEQYTLCVLQDF
jgi:hypothetical protein